MTVLRADRDGYTELTLDRPERRNALTIELLETLRDHLRAASGPVVLTGAGEAFCAGADVRADDDADERFALVGDVLRELRALDPPTLAAVNGPAIGGGWGLALARDVCFANRDAVFCLPEVAKGYRLPEPLVRRCSEVVGPVRAADLMFAGVRWDAGDALAAGAVSRVFDTCQALLAAARELCAALAASPRRSIETVKPRGVT